MGSRHVSLFPENWGEKWLNVQSRTSLNSSSTARVRTTSAVHLLSSQNYSAGSSTASSPELQSQFIYCKGQNYNQQFIYSKAVRELHSSRFIYSKQSGTTFSGSSTASSRELHSAGSSTASSQNYVQHSSHKQSELHSAGSSQASEPHSAGSSAASVRTNSAGSSTARQSELHSAVRRLQQAVRTTPAGSSYSKQSEHTFSRFIYSKQSELHSAGSSTASSQNYIHVKKNGQIEKI
ncbi:hypothetical protein AVEN_31541-1 [Araneus ventricosus]|uniref:Uncharacterized protein n=1 Tax=Araneus ventricosus TaxID=182803 RepID=A0A4Y2GQZ5_ARAVE|nr:hypothetical protein AVEN_31541-1 [Araneus ventricosus]